MNTGQVLKQAGKDKAAHQKNRGSNSIYRCSINQSFIQPLRSTLSHQPTVSYLHFQNRYFLIASALAQGLLFLILRRLEQACFVNGID